jgi:hypothetical protein
MRRSARALERAALEREGEAAVRRGRTWRAWLSAAVGRAEVEDYAGARGAEEREGPAGGRGDERAGHRVGAAGVGRRRAGVAMARRRVCAGGAAVRWLSRALLVKDLDVARRQACEVAKRAQRRRRLRSGGCGRIRMGAVGFLLGVNILAGVWADARRVAVEMAPVRAGFGFCGGRRGECDMARDRQPARLVSTSACAREATGHARAG